MAEHEHQMGVLNSEQCPQFFKFYMPEHCSTRLRIPPAFLKYFGDSLPFKFHLLTSPTNSWEVAMNKIDDDVYFKSGWEKFVQDNLLKFGDFLIFYYHGGSKFFVSISGKNNCLKEKIKITKNNIEKQPTPIQEKMKITNNIEKQPTPIQEKVKITNNNEKQPTPIQEKMKITNNNIEKQPTPIQEKMKITDNIENQPTLIQETDTNTTGEVIEDSKFSFEIKVQPCYMRNGYMNLPRVFYEGVKECRQMAKLQHLGRTWDVKVADCCDRIRFTSGWSFFAMENCLDVGDVCCFKVVDVKPGFYLIDVSFSREL